MPAIFFSNAWMLLGLVALSVPIIVHLLLRKKKKRARFSTVRFFLKQDEQSSQRRKLRNWLLLALRLLICALLVLAFARPYFQRSGPSAGQQKRQIVIVLDRSLSMQANAVDGPTWPRAREAVRHILSQLKPNDRAALISCGSRAEVLSEWAPAVAIARVLDELQPSCGAAVLGEGLQQAGRLLSFSDPKAATALYIVSDLQRASSRDLGTYPVPQNTEIKLVKVGDLVTPNLAITDLQTETTDDLKPHATLTSFSDEATAAVNLDLTVDGKVTSSWTVLVAAGASTNVDFAVPPLKPGWHDLAMRIRGHDALGLDDGRYQTVFVPEPARVLVAEASPGKRAFEQESFFVTTALDPAKDSTNATSSRFAFEKVNPDELAARLLSKQERLACDLVVLPGLKQIPSALGQALTRYVNAGGGLLLFLGEGVSANRYNAEFRGLLPVELGSVQACAETELGWRIGECNTNTAMFAAFQHPNSGDLSLARFTRRFSLPASAADLVLARFEDGTPFVLRGAAGRSRVVLVNTSADTSWNDWPKHKTFVPWLHGTGHDLAGLIQRDQVQAAASLNAGTDADLDLGPKASKALFKLDTPNGKAFALTADDRGQFRDVTLRMPGVYSLRDAAGSEWRRLAVNVPVQESDLAALTPSDFQRQLVRAPQPQPTTLAAGLFGSGSNQNDLGRVLLLAVLGLLIAEVLLANRTLA